MTNRKLARRYRSGYWAGKLINAIGILITFSGLILALALVGVTIRATEIMNQYHPAMVWVRDNLQIAISQQYEVVGGVGGALGLITFLLFWLMGTFVSAAAQILKAVLDTAVNTSPFL